MLSLGVLICIVYVVLFQALLMLPWSLITLTLNSKNQWLLKNNAGKEIQVLIEGQTFVSHYLTVINMRDAKNRRRYSMVIIPERVDTEDYRILRVLLRWGNVYRMDSADVFEKSVM